MHANQAKALQARRHARWDKERADAGGEGSRGGVVIGRTSSGKPIYKNHKHEGHKGFTTGDHGEAALLHKKLADKAKPKKERGKDYKPWPPERLQHSEAMAHHLKMNKQKRDRWDAQGEGSRGGKIIGHTGSGKPIYASANPPKPGYIVSEREHKELHPDFKTQDHIDAIRLHHKEVLKGNQAGRRAPAHGSPEAKGHPAILAGYTGRMHEVQRDRHLKSIGAKNMTHLNKAIKAGAVKQDAK